MFPNEHPAITDHMSLVTDLNIRLETHTDPHWQNIRVADCKGFREVLEPKLSELKSWGSHSH